MCFQERRAKNLLLFPVLLFLSSFQPLAVLPYSIYLALKNSFLPEQHWSGVAQQTSCKILSFCPE